MKQFFFSNKNYDFKLQYFHKLFRKITIYIFFQFMLIDWRQEEVLMKINKSTTNNMFVF